MARVGVLFLGSSQANWPRRGAGKPSLRGWRTRSASTPGWCSPSVHKVSAHEPQQAEWCCYVLLLRRPESQPAHAEGELCSTGAKVGERHFTSFHHPQASSLARQRRTAASCLAAICQHIAEEWDVSIDIARVRKRECEEAGTKGVRGCKRDEGRPAEHVCGGGCVPGGCRRGPCPAAGELADQPCSLGTPAASDLESEHGQAGAG